MYCSNCGKKIPLHSEFCPYCGHKQAAPKKKPTPKVTSHLNKSNKPNPNEVPKRTQQTHYINYRAQFRDFYKHNKKYCWGWAIAAVVLALLAVGVYHHHENTSSTPPTVTQQQSSPSSSSNSSSTNNSSSHEHSQPDHFVGPSSKTITDQTLETVWTQISSDASATGLPIKNDPSLYKYFTGGKSNSSFQVINQKVHQWAHSTKFNHDHISMKPIVISIHKDGNTLNIKYLVKYFFPEKMTPNNDPTPRTGLYEHYMYHATLTKSGKKIISNKGDSQPTYKHYNHQEAND